MGRYSCTILHYQCIRWKVKTVTMKKVTINSSDYTTGFVFIHCNYSTLESSQFDRYMYTPQTD